MYGDDIPIMPFFPESKPASIHLGDDFACTLLENGQIYCWGVDYGIGYNVNGSEFNYIDLGTGYVATKLISRGLFSCAFLQNACIKCWGQNPVRTQVLQ
jgi:hypothetical protein